MDRGGTPAGHARVGGGFGPAAAGGGVGIYHRMVRFDTIAPLMANDIASFFGRHWGDVASVAGFIYAIITLLRTKKAAEQAKMVAIQIREQTRSCQRRRRVGCCFGDHRGDRAASSD
ncbi:hypothetical protein SBA4_2910010 [Candidatus Sulfopaludibacter sp. SbA4]|nr:hypothetical protein SBA4_2910010 [Candidatus Sulfopaludibacter sp. SbA4]